MQRRHLIAAAAAAAVAVLAGCASPQIGDYRNEKPVLELRSYFNGTLDAHGVFTDRWGKVVKRFTVRMQCSWQGKDGVLDEDFLYSDGSRQKRVWRLTDLGDGMVLAIEVKHGLPFALEIELGNTSEVTECLN